MIYSLSFSLLTLSNFSFYIYLTTSVAWRLRRKRVRFLPRDKYLFGSGCCGSQRHKSNNKLTNPNKFVISRFWLNIMRYKYSCFFVKVTEQIVYRWLYDGTYSVVSDTLDTTNPSYRVRTMYRTNHNINSNKLFVKKV